MPLLIQKPNILGFPRPLILVRGSRYPGAGTSLEDERVNTLAVVDPQLLFFDAPLELTPTTPGTRMFPTSDFSSDFRNRWWKVFPSDQTDDGSSHHLEIQIIQGLCPDALYRITLRLRHLRVCRWVGVDDQIGHRLPVAHANIATVKPTKMKNEIIERMSIAQRMMGSSSIVQYHEHDQSDDEEERERGSKIVEPPHDAAQNRINAKMKARVKQTASTDGPVFLIRSPRTVERTVRSSSRPARLVRCHRT